MRARIILLSAILAAQTASADVVTVSEEAIVEWKAVYGQVETRDRVPARARIGGTIVSLEVAEGDRVEAGQRIALVEDDKLAFQLDSIDARLEALRARLETASADLERGRQLLERGVISTQRLDQLQTAVDVIEGDIRSLESERLVIEQQVAEGEVLSPDAGVVLSVPISRGSVIAPGEPVAVIAGGGVFLRLAVPERHARDLAEGDEIEIGSGSDDAAERRTGRLVKLYPQIAGGRVEADVEVEGLDGRYVGLRVPVRLPVGERMAILVPETALTRHGGLDFVNVETAGGEAIARAVVPGETISRDGETWREILTGLEAGDRVVTENE
ncbi:efflux RND transporter periplasmic adaptor subunit [Ostreiculturibacter nitratireducens]|uniref:efflux RND transporter periplasmic adaptor subunit n=1 Tax=Ostreiculturibacter nitratireducens TaxID=3075226 RepID=UPI0031B59224